MQISLEDLQANLQAARQAYHDLNVGAAVAEFQDSNGERVRYNRASLPQLRAYITDLETKIANYDKKPTSGPMRVLF